MVDVLGEIAEYSYVDDTPHINSVQKSGDPFLQEIQVDKINPDSLKTFCLVRLVGGE